MTGKHEWKLYSLRCYGKTVPPPQEDCVKFIFCTYELRPFNSLSCTKFVKLLM